MRQVTVAKSAGFCFGVKRAVETVYRQLEDKEHNIYTFGPIIHNEEVVADLASKGVQVVDSLEEIENLTPGVMIIRSHGVGRVVYERLEQAGFRIVDATCPFVKKIHRHVEEYCNRGYAVIIIGNESHPEVEGIRGWGIPEQIQVVGSADEAAALENPGSRKLCIVSQTTFNYNKFQELVEIIEKKGYDIIVLNTICSATEERQTEARALARESDAMIVIGGRSSSNTQKLFEICESECENTYYIQTIHDLDLDEFHHIDNVGITAGASTPNKIIEEVQNNVRNEF